VLAHQVQVGFCYFFFSFGHVMLMILFLNSDKQPDSLKVGGGFI